ncbi:MAG: site-2 protease family protein [Planctomycetota bacterium]|jgi:regulator of sigma E protease
MSESESPLSENALDQKPTEGGSTNYFRGILLLVIVAAVISLIVRNIAVFGNILKVIIGFGGVVLVHELGHFVVAKFSGITVEAFSIGFPPTLVGVRRTEQGYRVRFLPTFFPKDKGGSEEGGLSFTVGNGGRPWDTEYRIGLVPFGGYNKILGQEDTKAVEHSDNPRSFANKPVGTRMAVIAAGVIFNAISAILVFMIVFLIGIKLVPPVVGGVMPNSPAARAGLKAGDRIIEIAGKTDNFDFRNIILAAILSGRDEKVPLKVRREDRTEETVVLVAERLPTFHGEMRDFGIDWPMSLTIEDVSDPEKLYSETGLKPGDRVTAVDGGEVNAHWEMEQAFQNANAPAVTLSVQREDPVSKKTEIVDSQVHLGWSCAGSLEVESESELCHVYSMVPRLRVTDVSADSDANDIVHAVRSGDIILAAGAVENPTYKELRDVTEEYEGRALPVRVLRADVNGVERPFTVTVEPKRRRGADRATIGIFPVLDAGHPVVAKSISSEDGPAALPIPRGAVITAVDQAPVSSFYDIVKEIREGGGRRVQIDYRLDDGTSGSVALDAVDAERFITVKSDFAEYVPFRLHQELYKAGGPAEAIVMGCKKTFVLVIQTYLSIRRLIEGLVSQKEFSGPVGLIKVSYDIAARRPLLDLVYFLSQISVLLAVFNLLPVPPFDGGWLVMLAIERVKGSALSQRAQEVVAYAGVLFILALFVFLTFNDILNIFFR